MPLAAQSVCLEAARAAQSAWAEMPVRARIGIVRELRHNIATHAQKLLDGFPGSLRRSRADSLASEIVPLAEACRFLELEAERILRPKRLSNRGRPLWLRTVHVQVRREPLGVVLLIGPSNYPLFLTGVQAIQALVAGNAVVLKPGSGALRVSSTFGELIRKAGLPNGLLTILDESAAAARDAIHGGVNKIVFTGSVESGRWVLREAAEEIVPVTAELSGFDPVFVLPGADLKRAAAAVAFGANLNGGATCIAPRRIYVHRSISEAFQCEAPVTIVEDENEALALAAACPYALGATIFGGESSARALARRVNAGVVVVNDMIVPTADPRVSFGGRGLSGYGTTRGAIGLLEMTTPKTVIVQRGKRLRHLEPPPANAEEFFLAYLSAAHRGSMREKLGGWRRFFRAVMEIRKVKQ